MDGPALTDEAALTAEDAGLARAAAAGDRSAFAALYERHGPLAFNLAYRITGSKATAATAVREAFLDTMRRLSHPPDHELPFGSALLIATRHACFELTDGRPGRSLPGPAIAAAVDPEALAGAEDEVRAASLRLPERQREVLALRELGGLSYEEIALIVETSRGSVAQLISRARINLSDELHGTVLAAIAAPSTECERALPLIASREDGQLEAGSRDAAWLDSHLSSCERCRLGVEAMQEASASYGSWAPLAIAPGLLEETMARTAELTGADSGREMATAAIPTAVAPPPSPPPNRAADRGGHGRRRAMLAAGLALLLLLAGVVTVLGGDDPPATPVGSAADNQADAKAKPGKQRLRSAKSGKAEKGAARKATAAPTAETQLQVATEGGAASESSPAPSPKSSPAGGITVQPTKQASPSKPGSKAKPTPAPVPAPEPVAAAAPPPPTEEPEKTHGNGRGQGEPPGHSPDHPAKK